MYSSFAIFSFRVFCICGQYTILQILLLLTWINVFVTVVSLYILSGVVNWIFISRSFN